MKLAASFLFSFLLVTQAGAQKSKVQSAWRSLTEYEETLKDGNPDITFLNKAKEAIDLALTNEDTRKQAKTHAYKLRISYAQFQYDLASEMKRLESTVPDKTERAMSAYGNTSLTEFENAAQSLNTIKDLDPKFLENISEALLKGTDNLDEDELKFALAVQQMKMEAGNIASGKYKAKRYEEAADYFYKTAFINTILFRTKDTANFYNACVAAGRSKNTDKILDYNKKMIEAGVSSPYNYESLYNANLSKGDSSAAIESLKKGRNAYPSDIGLLTQETNLFLATGKQQQALDNLKLSVQRDPNNALFYFIIGNIYDNLANPKDKASGKELPKPSNFDELFKSAEENYLKSIELKPANKEYLYNSLYNLGAMYYNQGAFVTNQNTGKITDAVKQQKANELKAQESYKKAIPYLEQALALRSDDKQTMTALRRLYMTVGNEAKAKEMGDRLKAAQ